MEQGSGGWSAQFFLLYVLGCCLVPLWDLSHRIWNDCKGALFAVPELYDAFCCSLQIMNLDMGPWESYAWWSQVQEAAQQYHKDHDSTETLWQHFLFKVLNDIGSQDKAFDSSFLQQLWGDLPSSFVSRRMANRLGLQGGLVGSTPSRTTLTRQGTGNLLSWFG